MGNVRTNKKEAKIKEEIMKKALSLLLAALMLLSVLTACGPQSGSESTDPPADKTTPPHPPKAAGTTINSKNMKTTHLKTKTPYCTHSHHCPS